MIATITLNPSIDQTLTVNGLVKDDANRAESSIRHAGGKGLNVSKVVRELGGPTFACAMVGGFVGGYWRKLVDRIDVPHWTLEIDGDTRVNTILTDRKDGTQTRISAPGPCATRAQVKAFLRRLVTMRPKPFFWALGGSLPYGMQAGAYREFVETLQKTGVRCILDADDEALRRGVKAKPYLIKPNEYEMERLVGRRLRTLKDYLRAARSLNASGIERVIVSLGPRGALFVSKEKEFMIPAVPVPVRSHVGAGDSLVGGLALGLFRGKRFEEAALLGMAASHSAVLREAPRLCLRKDVPGLLRRLKVRPVRG